MQCGNHAQTNTDEAHMLDGFKTTHFDASCADAGALVMTETVNDNGFYRWNYDQPMHIAQQHPVVQ
jgi:hypothetical protein